MANHHFKTFNGNGGGGQLAYNLNNWLGVLGDVSGLWAERDQTGSRNPVSIWPEGKPPARQDCARGFSSLVASTAALIATGWNEPAPGRVLNPAVDHHLFTAHPVIRPT